MIKKIKRIVSERGLKVYFKPRTLSESLVRNAKVKHMLVVGLPRSGTSFLQRLLNAKDGIFVSYESIYQPFISNNSVESLHAYYYEIIKQYHHLASLHGSDHSEHMSNLKPFTFLASYSYFGDKVIYQHSSEFRGKLRKAINAKITDKVIFIVRDPRDRMLSYFEWMKKRDRIYKNTVKKDEVPPDDAIVKESEKWNEFVTDVHTLCQQHPKCMMLKYEDLVQPDTGCFDQMLAHLEVASTDDHLAYYHNSISNLSVNKWKDKMDMHVIRQIEERCGENLKKLLYELSSTR